MPIWKEVDKRGHVCDHRAREIAGTVRQRGEKRVVGRGGGEVGGDEKDCVVGRPPVRQMCTSRARVAIPSTCHRSKIFN